VHCAVRLFTRTPGHRWRGVVREHVEGLHALDAPLPIRHHGWADPAVRRAKLERDRALLERIGPGDPALALHLAQARLALDDSAGAVDAAEDGLRRVPASDRTLGLLLLDTLAAARFAAGQQAGAEEACRAALALRPDWIDPRLLLGRLCRESGRTREALGHLGRFLDDRARLLDDPTWPVRLPHLRALGAEAEARTELAMAHAMLGALGRAQREAERAAALAPSSAGPIRVLAHIADAARAAGAQWGVTP
jgi:tetratricopeptide (TPR) repeat protein